MKIYNLSLRKIPRRIIRIYMLISLLAILPLCPSAASSWDVLELGGGAVMPHGTFRNFSSDGSSGTIKIVLTPFDSRMIGFVGSLTGNSFEQKARDRYISRHGFTDLKNKYSSFNGSFGIRLQTKKNIFRPYGEIAAGLYSFNMTTSINYEYAPNVRRKEYQLLTGYNISAGVALWLLQNVGLNFNIKYDNVFNLGKSVDGIGWSHFNAHFTSIYLGLQLPFSSAP